MENKTYERWLAQCQGELREELESIRDKPREISLRFDTPLSFGTAGLRGVLGAGTARMNVHTVGLATQAFADTILAQGGEDPCVAIAWDSRHGSRLFAEITARVMAANGVKAYLYRELMPTPALSFAVRYLGCRAGVMVTASHNPAQYNGYKAYGPDGGQLTPQAADEIYRRMQSMDCFSDVKALSWEEGVARGLIARMGDEVEEAYLEEVQKLSLSGDREANGELRIVYTPLNGAGLGCVTKTLSRMGFSRVQVVPEQREPDGDFPTCPYPNPEMREAMELGFRLLEREGADLLLATDPDSDRVGVGVRDGEGGSLLLSGNEIGALMLDYICRRRRELGRMPERPVIVRSVVSSDLTDQIAAEYGASVRTVMTGFKYVGEILTELEREGREEDFLFAFEESHGYLTGAHVRDKDAVNACLVLAEMAALLRKEGKTLAGRLEELYARYGYHFCKVSSRAFGGPRPMEEMKAAMERLRRRAPRELAGRQVTALDDFAAGVLDVGGREEPTGLPRSEMLRFRLAEGWAIARPSGTEPKLKIYLDIRGENREKARELAQAVERELEDILFSQGK